MSYKTPTFNYLICTYYSEFWGKSQPFSARKSGFFNKIGRLARNRTSIYGFGDRRNTIIPLTYVRTCLLALNRLFNTFIVPTDYHSKGSSLVVGYSTYCFRVYSPGSCFYLDMSCLIDQTMIPTNTQIKKLFHHVDIIFCILPALLLL